MSASKKLMQYAIRLLLEHWQRYDPYVDDAPSARHAGREHRERCEICQCVEKYPKVFGLLIVGVER